MQKATVLPKRKVAYFDESEPVQMRLHKSLKLWSMYADLEESFGTFKVSVTIRSNFDGIHSCKYSPLALCFRLVKQSTTVL
jgi:pre-mRNA-splicing factor SYF1